jgi:hypothetical protein
MSTLPEIPSLEDLASVPLTAHPLDLRFNPPALKNAWGQAQVSRGISGVGSITFPPHAVCCRSDNPWHHGALSTGELFLNGQLVSTLLPPDARIRFQWFPHLVRRALAWQGWQFTVDTCLPWGTCALLQRIVLTRTGTGTAARFAFHAGAMPGTFPHGESAVAPVCRESGPPHYSRAEATFQRHDPIRRTWTVEGFFGDAAAVPDNGLVGFERRFRSGESCRWYHAIGCGASPAQAIDAFHHCRENPLRSIDRHAEAVRCRIGAAFKPGNRHWSGHLPVLRTANRALWRLYHAAFATVWMARAEIPDARIAMGYRAIGPSIHATRFFPWDTALGADTLARLDPEPLKALLLHWLGQPLHLHSHSCALAGRMSGSWYPANHWAVVRIARALIDRQPCHDWLDTALAGRTVRDHLRDQGRMVESLADPATGLMDHSRSDLLEVVPGYRGITAGFNALWVELLDTLEAIAPERGPGGGDFGAKARGLARRIVDRLAVGESGQWRCIGQDGVPVHIRHVHDFLAVMNAFHPAEMPPALRNGMLAQLRARHLAPDWLQALAADGPDAVWSLRADHGWCGSYPAWPPMVALGMIRQGSVDGLAEWLTGMGETARHGVWGQAHLCGAAFSPATGPEGSAGAPKAPAEPPYQNEWYCLGGAAFGDLVLKGVFGKGLQHPEAAAASRRLREALDPDARLLDPAD